MKSSISRSGLVTITTVSASPAATREGCTVKAGLRSSKYIEPVGQGLDMARHRYSCNLMKADTRVRA